MTMTRRDPLRLSLAGGGGMALGGLIASGANLAPVVAQAQQLRIAKAQVTPSVRRRLRHAGPHRGRADRQHRGGSAQSTQRGHALSQGRRDLSAAYAERRPSVRPMM